MPDRSIRLSQPQADDLAVICSIGASSLIRVLGKVEDAPITIRASKLRETILTAQIGGDKADVLGRVLLGLATLMRRGPSNASEVLAMVSGSLALRWNPDQMKQWQDCRPVFERLLSSRSVTLATKATDLSYDVERFCIGSRIITDIRPVFDDEREAIVGSTIRQTLRLEFMSMDGSANSISVGLDKDDISRLKDACEEALRKATRAQETMRKAGLSETVVAGEDFQ
jgi:hypothetical protein